MILLAASLAFADSITLDTGATIEGDLARYEFGGNCQLSVTEGDLAGVILIVPCHRVESFQRTSARRPVPIGVEVESARQAAARATVAPVAAVAPAAAAAAPPVVATEPPPPEPVVADSSDVVTLVAEELTPEVQAAPLSEPVVAEDPVVVAPPPPPAPLPPLTTFGGVVDGHLMYDEPLFPSDAITPIAPEEAPSVEPERTVTAPQAAPAPTSDDPAATRAVRF